MFIALTDIFCSVLLPSPLPLFRIWRPHTCIGSESRLSLREGSTADAMTSLCYDSCEFHWSERRQRHIHVTTEDRTCANVARSTIQGTAALPCSSTWPAGTINWRSLTSEQGCHLSTIATCPLSCVSVSIVCRCSRCVFWHLHTVPIELLMSSTSVWLTRIGGRWRQVRFLESDCLELLLMQAAQNNGLTDGMKRETLQEVTYM